MSIKLHPLNDLAYVATVKTVTAAGALAPLETGTASCFLATSESPTATAADASLVGTATYTGVNGKWLVAYDAAALTPSLLASLFAAVTPHSILTFTDGIRVATPLVYEAANVVDVA